MVVLVSVRRGSVYIIYSQPMPWFLLNVPPTHKEIDVDIVVVVQFRGDKLLVSGFIGTM